MKRARLMVGVVLAAVVWWQGAILGFAAEPTKKLHLMYLVTAKADDLKPGSVVAVEPAFFTDGERIVFAYDFCRAVRAEKSHPKLVEEKRLLKMVREKTADDLRPIDNWCWNAKVVIPTKNLFGVDHEGLTIRLSALGFDNNTASGTGVLGNVSENNGKRDLTSVHRGYRFLLLGSSNTLLRRLVPLWKIESPELQTLMNRLEVVKEDAKWTVHQACRRLREIQWCDSAKQHPSTAPVQVVSWFGANIDSEGGPAIIAGLRSRQDTQGVLWQGMVILQKERQPWVRGSTDIAVDFSYDAIDGYWASLYLPKLAIHVRDCKYLVTGISRAYESIDLFALPDATRTCAHLHAVKVQEEDPYGGDN